MKATINKNGVEVSLSMTEAELNSLITGIGKTSEIGLQRMSLKQDEIDALQGLYVALTPDK